MTRRLCFVDTNIKLDETRGLGASATSDSRSKAAAELLSRAFRLSEPPHPLLGFQSNLFPSRTRVLKNRPILRSVLRMTHRGTYQTRLELMSALRTLVAWNLRPGAVEPTCDLVDLVSLHSFGIPITILHSE
ncbi:hypothetical protein GALMADRAFT_136247 [Galerina marginata CBS 339.88]|uniref:Uncharacterized protein n=1 Tax=Galerina marginata (strain CBS 339.88) TaxID=685588 RepID=A0A067TQF5_GALM3|nr:hypothetical protein GALMADRAFT_136247 [Galerina marginata CBS 339.88]